jgi:uncharacterized MAPEG superfamily protein
MKVELLCLVWSILIGLVHIFTAVRFKTKQLGVEWNMSARDQQLPALNKVTERLYRAQSNFLETYPFFIISILVTAITDTYSFYSYWGAIIYLVARTLYLPIYAMGIPKIRTFVWLISILSILVIIAPLLFKGMLPQSV